MTLRESKDSGGTLLPPVIRPMTLNNEPVVEREWCKATTVILVVLFVCGILAFGISAAIWHFYDDSDPNTTTTTATTMSEYSITDYVLVFICGFLVFGLSAVAWRYYQSLNKDKPATTTTDTTRSSSFPIVMRWLNNSTDSPSNEKMIVGYFTYFESTEITKSQISKLTHAVFAFLQMNFDGTLQFNNEKAETRFLSLRNKAKHVEPNVKVMFSIGGYENSQYFSSMIDDPKKKRTFIDSIISFIKVNQIDGVDLFWRWPSESDKFKYSSFLKELRTRLTKEGKQYILSIEAPPVGIENWETGFDMDEILENVDFVNVLSMDYYGPWDNQWGTPAGPSAPLYCGVAGRKNFNVDYTMQYYIHETKQPSKFNIVIPFYARLWKNVKEALQPENEVFRNAELKDNKAEGNPYMSRWTVEHEGWDLSDSTWDEASKSSYIWNPRTRTFLTFETNRSIAAKTNYVNEKNLGGVWIWSVDMDDARNSLLNAIPSVVL